jgi:hypothetical protein
LREHLHGTQASAARHHGKPAIPYANWFAERTGKAGPDAPQPS